MRGWAALKHVFIASCLPCLPEPEEQSDLQSICEELRVGDSALKELNTCFKYKGKEYVLLS